MQGLGEFLDDVVAAAIERAGVGVLTPQVFKKIVGGHAAFHAEASAAGKLSVGVHENTAVITPGVFVAIVRIGLRCGGHKRSGKRQQPCGEMANLPPAVHGHPRLLLVYSSKSRAEEKTEFCYAPQPFSIPP